MFLGDLLLNIHSKIAKTIQSSYGPAITYIQSGMTMLSEVKYKGQQSHHLCLEGLAVLYVPGEILEELFMQLDLQVN